MSNKITLEMMANEFLLLASEDKNIKCFKVAELYKPEMADKLDSVLARFTDDDLNLSLDEFSSKFIYPIKTTLLEGIHLNRDDTSILVFGIKRDVLKKSNFITCQYKNIIINIEKQNGTDENLYSFKILYKKLSNKSN